jgi:hypothetical protein
LIFVAFLSPLFRRPLFAPHISFFSFQKYPSLKNFSEQENEICFAKHNGKVVSKRNGYVLIFVQNPKRKLVSKVADYTCLRRRNTKIMKNTKTRQRKPKLHHTNQEIQTLSPKSHMCSLKFHNRYSHLT